MANLRFTTLPRLAVDLAASMRSDDGALPATETVVRAVARMTLGAARTQVLGSARDHPGTARSLVRLYRDLSGVSAATRRRLTAGGGRAAAVVSLVGTMEDRLRHGWIDDAGRIDLAIEAISAMDGDDPADELVVVYIPTRLSFHDQRLVAALAHVRSVVVILGLTGDPSADSMSREMAARLGADGRQAAGQSLGQGVPPLTGTMVISAPTADTEVRVVARRTHGPSPGRYPVRTVAIVHGGSGPYERLVRETLAGAGVPCNGISTRTLETTFAGRTLLGAFELHERDARAEVMAWVAGGPRRTGNGKPVEATAWDLISREAGVTTGLESWRHHLGTYIEERALRLGGLVGPGGIETRRRGPPPGCGRNCAKPANGQVRRRSGPATRGCPRLVVRVGGLGRRPPRSLPRPTGATRRGVADR